MKFCRTKQCEHYDKATKYPRACYYEPQCWRGCLDLAVSILKFRASTPQNPCQDEDFRFSSTLADSTAVRKSLVK